MGLNTKGIAVLAVVGLAVVYFGGKYAINSGLIGRKAESVSAIPEVTSIQKFQVGETRASYTLPVAPHATTVRDVPVMEVLAWNAESGLIYANGGDQTQRGSLVEKYTGGASLLIKRQDDYGQMEANLAKHVQSGGQSGDAFFIIMGDAYPYVAAALNKLIPGKFVAISTIGFSDGEDQCMMERKIADAKGKGALIAAVPRDGDWNICVKWASDNGIKVNTDQKTFDPDAMNFMDVNAFTDADDKLIAQACETRTLVSGSMTRGSAKVCVNGVATWTPGDVDVVQKYMADPTRGTAGDLVGVASTHDYAGQMPAQIIGDREWMAAHRDYVVGLLKASDRGAMAIRSGQAFSIMDTANQAVFQDKAAGPGYWSRYYKGDSIVNHAGQMIRVGGSKVATLQDARDYFGMRAGTSNVYESVYRVFKGYDEKFYPVDYPRTGANSIPDFASVMDMSYLTEALQGIPETQGVSVAAMAVATPITQAVSTRSWHIEFDTGRATIKPESMPQLYEIKDSAAIASSLRLRLDGFTDATGSADRNLPLSQARAQAVATWLNQQAPNTFPETRMEARGFGSAQPTCKEATTACYAQNRRVDIVLGN